jgi:hypothetical protein
MVQQEGKLGAEARRARCEARRRDHRRFAQADGRDGRPTRRIPSGSRSRRPSRSLPTTCRRGPKRARRVEAIKDQLLDNKSVSLWIDTLWQKAREAVIKGRPKPGCCLCRQAWRNPEIDGRDTGKRPSYSCRDQPVCASRRGRHVGELRGLDGEAGLGNRPRLGCGNGDCKARSSSRAWTSSTFGSTAPWSGGLVGLVLHAMDSL